MSTLFYILGLILIGVGAFLLVQKHKGGNVCNNKHCNCCKQEPLELIVKFEKPLEVNVNINIVNPEPEVKGILTLGPVSEKKA